MASTHLYRIYNVVICFTRYYKYKLPLKIYSYNNNGYVAACLEHEKLVLKYSGTLSVVIILY